MPWRLRIFSLFKSDFAEEVVKLAMLQRQRHITLFQDRTQIFVSYKTGTNVRVLLWANSHTRLSLPMTIYRVAQIMGVERRDR